MARTASQPPTRSSAAEPATPLIRVLPDAVKSRIAAGEVIERPASVLKELVENALDAGATRLDIDLEAGGRARLRVADNGHGMNRANLLLSVARHATSKINEADELYALSSFGFRGEALPSIASVSRLTITSRPPSSEAAWKLTVDGGSDPVIEPAAGAVGTVVDVAELFFNLPARAKFLKGAGPEAAACADMILRLALVRPEVAFTLRQGRQTILDCRACPPAAACKPRRAIVAGSFADVGVAAYARRTREALGKSFAEALVPVAAETRPTQAAPDSEPYRLFGLLTPPAHTRPNRSNLYLAVNGRPVRDRTLLGAVTEAYRHLLPPRRFPAGVLMVEVPGDEVDINVHPTKSEVRFKTPGIVYGLLHRAIREAFTAEPARGGPTEAAGGAPTVFDAPPGAPLRSRTPSASQAVPTRSPTGAPSRADTTTPRRNLPSFDLWRAPRRGMPTAPRGVPPSPLASTAEARPDTTPASAAEAPAAFRTSRAQSLPADLADLGESAAPAADFRVLGQAGGMYLVVEDAEGLKVIDQHALHERLLFEDLIDRARGVARNGEPLQRRAGPAPAPAQRLLVPEPVELSPAQAAAFGDEATVELLENFGFQVEPFGPAAVAVSAVPARLKDLPPDELIAEILDAAAELSEESTGPRGSDGGGGPIDPSELAQRAAYRLACRGAIKAGETLTLIQASALMEEAQRRIGSHCARWTCPHGRPLALAIDWGQLDRHVGRA